MTLFPELVSVATTGGLRTDRLILRAPLPSDLDALIERRNHPDVPDLQAWALPYPRERGETALARVCAEGPVDDKTWMLTVLEAASGEIVGDVVVGPSWQGRSVEIGYGFHPRVWGRGYATEAAAAVVDHLFSEEGVTRVSAMMHPDNFASARVAESCGMLFEGHSRSSYWIDDQVSDDLIYAMTRSDWQAWISRPRHRPAKVRLVELSHDNVRSVLGLETHRSQRRFVSTMPASFADMAAPKPDRGRAVVATARAIEADGELVGFIMWDAPDRSTYPDEPPYLWRLLIDRMHQRRGVSTAALDEFEAMLTDAGYPAVEVSWVEGAGSPRPFYEARGYAPTGEIEDGETVARKPLN